MTHRSFKDRQGKRWDVWQVHPSQAERRFSQRRVNKSDLTDTAQRRSGVERRESETPPHKRSDPQHRPLVAAEFAYGWLCFESGGEKKRLAPVPVGWQDAGPDRLSSWLQAAKRVVKCGP